MIGKNMSVIARIFVLICIAAFAPIVLFSHVSAAEIPTDENIASHVFTAKELSKIYSNASSNIESEEVYKARLLMSMLYKYGNSSAGIAVDEKTSQDWLKSANYLRGSSSAAGDNELSEPRMPTFANYGWWKLFAKSPPRSPEHSVDLHIQAPKGGGILGLVCNENNGFSLIIADLEEIDLTVQTGVLRFDGEPLEAELLPVSTDDETFAFFINMGLLDFVERIRQSKSLGFEYKGKNNHTYEAMFISENAEEAMADLLNRIQISDKLHPVCLS